MVGGPVVRSAHRWAPPAVAFEHVLTECGHGGGDAAVGAHGIGTAGLECWVGCAMDLRVTALLCCYLFGV